MCFKIWLCFKYNNEFGESNFDYLVLQIVLFLPEMTFLWEKFYLCSYFFQIVYDVIEYDRILKNILIKE